MTVHPELRPVYDETGKILLELTTAAFSCPTCMRRRNAPARSRTWICPCGETLEFEVKPEQWTALVEEHRAKPINAWTFVSKSMASTWWRR